jgi:hypothetical protein
MPTTWKSVAQVLLDPTHGLDKVDLEDVLPELNLSNQADNFGNAQIPRTSFKSLRFFRWRATH